MGSRQCSRRREGSARSRAQLTAALGEERSVGCVKWVLGVLGADPAAVPEVGAGAG